MSNKIEVGCLVLCIAGINQGSSGVVIEHDSLDHDFPWGVDFGRDAVGLHGIPGKPVWCKHNELIRIDDHQEETYKQKEELMV